MHDVSGHVVFAGADENLGAGNGVGAVGLGFGLGAQQTQVGTALGFGEAHRTCPLAGDQFGQVFPFLLGVAVRLNRVDGAVAEAGIHDPGPVGRSGQFIDHDTEHIGHALAAILHIRAQCRPAIFNVLAVGLLVTCGGGDAFLAPVATFLVAGAIQGRYDVLRKARGLSMMAFISSSVASP